MKRIVITGASRGIGRAVAVRFARDGAKLLLQGRDESLLEESRKEVKDAGGSADTVIAELSRADAFETIYDAAGKERLDVLVNNAGLTCVKPFEQIGLDEWQRIFAVNVTAPFLLTKKLIHYMGEGSAIVNILSIASRSGFPNWSAYCMSKFALDGWAKSIREELRERGIRVINIYPAATDTDIWQQVEGKWAREKMMKAQDVSEAVYYAVNTPGNVMVDDITLESIAGKL